MKLSALERAANALSRLSRSTEALTFAANQIERLANELKLAAPGVVKLGDGAESLASTAHDLVFETDSTRLGLMVTERADRVVDLGERFVTAAESAAETLSRLAPSD